MQLIRAAFLDEVRTAVLKERNATYGEPDQDFTRTAAILNALGFCRASSDIEGEPRALTGADLAQIMIALKLSRLAWSPGHRDSWVDVAGYAACGLETEILRNEAQHVESQEASRVAHVSRAHGADDLRIIREVAAKTGGVGPVDLTGR